MNNSVLTRPLKQDGDEDRSQVAAGREFQAQDRRPPNYMFQRDSQERGIIRSQRACERRHEQAVVADTRIEIYQIRWCSTAEAE